MDLLAIRHKTTDQVGLVAEMPFEVHVHDVEANPEVPPLGDFKAVIVMGGPQAAYSDEHFPSRQSEVRLIRDAFEAGVPLLGICLGSQLLSIALGGRGYRRTTPEIGWLPVELTEAGAADPLLAGCPSTFIPFHKHFDSYEMPEGATRLASSDQCLEQGFRLGNAWGLQFHFEMKPDPDRVVAAKAEVEAKSPAKMRLPTAFDEEGIESLRDLVPTATRILSNFSQIVHNLHGVNV